MNWTLITNLVFALNLVPSNIGLSTSAPTNFSYATYQNVRVGDYANIQAVSFEIDSSTVQGWGSISTVQGTYTAVQGQTSGTVDITLPTQDNPFVFVDLLASDKEVGLAAYDVLVYSVKNTLSFSATNTARAFMVDLLELYRLTSIQKIAAYENLAEHPDFPKLVEIYASGKGVPTSDEVLSNITSLQVEIINSVLPGVLQETSATEGS